MEGKMELNLDEMSMINGGANAYGGYKDKPEKKHGCRIYQIQKGDTLGNIARAHNTTVEEIMKVNPEIKDYNKIMMGYFIYIPKT